MLKPYYKKDVIEAGCDEAGRGCLAGPVFAAAVILPPGFRNKILNDSKQVSDIVRYQLREVIQKEALAFAVASLSNEEIDKVNILNASIFAMQKAVSLLSIRPQSLLIDGNRFKPFEDIPHHCMVKGDARFLSIAAASILAKTYRDDFMKDAALKYPGYGWEKNMGYPTKEHRDGIRKYGATPLHRMSFTLLPNQLEMEF